MAYFDSLFSFGRGLKSCSALDSTLNVAIDRCHLLAARHQDSTRERTDLDIVVVVVVVVVVVDIIIIINININFKKVKYKKEKKLV